MTKRFFSILGLFVLASASAFAQTELRWDAHGVGFTVPSNFKIEANNVSEFTAGNDNLFLTIAPIQDEDLTKDNLADAIVAMAEGMEYDNLEKVAEAEVHDFVGYYVIGEKDGAHALLMAMMDTESSTNLLVVVVYTGKTEREAMKIANSFFAYD